MKTRRGAFSAEGSASHLARTNNVQLGGTHLLPRASSTTRETHLSAKCRRRSGSHRLRTNHADRRPLDAFPATQYVASLAMARVTRCVPPACMHPFYTLSAHGNVSAWRFARTW